MAGSMATTSNAAMRKKTPFYVSIFMIHDTRPMLQLREKDCQALKAALGKFPEVRHVWVFGSRATGKARRASGIDLVIEAPGLSPARWHALQEALEQTPVIYNLDIVRLDTLDDPDLKRAILAQRIPVDR